MICLYNYSSLNQIVTFVKKYFFRDRVWHITIHASNTTAIYGDAVKILTGELERTAGDVKVLGYNANLLKTADFKSQIGILSDNSSLYERLTVYDPFPNLPCASMTSIRSRGALYNLQNSFKLGIFRRTNISNRLCEYGTNPPWITGIKCGRNNDLFNDVQHGGSDCAVQSCSFFG